MEEKDLIIVRGAGDISTGTIHRLWRAGFGLLVLETAHPAAIRRQVALSEAVYEGTACVEGVTAKLIPDAGQVFRTIGEGMVPILIDPEGECIRHMKPAAVVDAILAKKNLGTTMDMAPLTIALGPGFEAGRDVHFVIETMRGHRLGRIITDGPAMANTGVPGVIGGYGAERVIHAPAEGVLQNICHVGDTVRAGQVIALIGEEGTQAEVKASIDGILRGLIRDGYPVTKGFKIADIDPRYSEHANCFTISDKSRCIAGSVLELVCSAGIGKRV